MISLRYGAANARTKKHLSQDLGISQRAVELLIHAARLEGAPIISTSDGYHLSDDPAEIRACARRLRSRAVHQMSTAAALDRAAAVLPMTLWRDAA